MLLVLVWLQVSTDGIPQLANTVRLRTGTTAVRVSFLYLFVFFHRDFLVEPVFVTTGGISGK
eukprot:TRINITY_DN3901_c1_g1_i1.p3 TRINITY_DN3901_c1_g1~~TRINITY_DN3901_c1_g1_i1.p3  ORF type:complete len:62 (+),score=6.77 TRINITY_DN3901_c1_g1_i1:73-258(+)